MVGREQVFHLVVLGGQVVAQGLSQGLLLGLLLEGLLAADGVTDGVGLVEVGKFGSGDAVFIDNGSEVAILSGDAVSRVLRHGGDGSQHS